MKMTINEMALATGARIMGNGEREILWLLTDSRSLGFAAETLFFALPSATRDSLQFIPELYSRGVRAFVVPEGFEGRIDTTVCSEASFLVVKDTLKALQMLARHHRLSFDVPVIAVTGSNGKTIVKEWLYQLLSPDWRITRSPRSYNSQVGVPLSLWEMDEMTQLAIIEAGISQPGEMERLAEMILPTIGVFTGLGDAHQENFDSLEQKGREKMKLFASCSKVVCPDGTDCAGMKGDVVRWAWGDATADLCVTAKDRVTSSSTRISAVWKGDTAVSFRIPFVDDASVMNACSCAALCLSLGMDQSVLAKRMQHLQSVAMRLDVKEGVRDISIIYDSYNSDYTGLDMALDFMNRQDDAHSLKRVLILGDMQQTGDSHETFKSKVRRMVEGRGVDETFFVGPALDGIIPGSRWWPSVDEFLRSPELATLRGCQVLLKGSHNSGFDRILDRLEKRVHETILDVDLGALAENLKYFRSRLKPETKITCMVKASAYGAGSVEVSRTLQNCGVDYLAVAVADEGVALRGAGIRTNIMVMNPEMSALDTLFKYNLQPEVYSFRILDALIASATAAGITQYPVHIKLDTGMHRLGFNPETDMERLVAVLKSQQALVPCSVFSHFAGSDSDDFDEFSRHQAALFEKGADILQNAYQHHIIRHLDNSAGIEHFPDCQLDMVRLGLGLYGISSRDGRVLSNVSTLRTTILQIRDVPRDETVGYSRRGTLSRDSRIAALPIGYADGLDRRLGCGRGYCVIAGRKAPYVGNICMDVSMVDVTDIPCEEGDQAIIFGAPDIPVTELSDAIGTIPYEILTSVSDRVKRVYYKE
ncbi:MAG: bifunctional UDP-N-acetylmuramoyl-tripeptide:D-alanyl-D-alanine ligase/alanine racemase [Bacteroidales bacterium]|nr:bifunctional UDP-N-acetylmuramoyl-tripeptide:D-alanyl-D-alanine ligase/alanine racemase [Bacteroidales bacterium]